MNFQQLIVWLQEHEYFSQNITKWHTIPPRQATFAEFPSDINPELSAALHRRNIRQLYSHQRRAYDMIQSGYHTALLTPTASGKTLSYNLPVLNRILAEPQTRAMYLFPTKALAQDQLKEVYGIIEQMEAPIKTYTFDGDTPVQARKAIRQAGQIIITNPDMLHQGILPHHTIWLKLFENLKFIVIDEIHYYKGVMGAHLANVIRRLKRLALFYGSQPQFICCSATSGSSREFIEKILGEPVEMIEENGAPSGEKHVVFYNPPVVNWQLGIRRGVVAESRKLGELFLQANVQSIIFARSRIRVEVISTYLKNIAARKFGSAALVKAYRGGFLPGERRDIERGLKENKIKCVVSTNALELGVDIGSLDVAIMAGYPGSVASAWQQAGRAGRRQSESLAIIIASSSPMDQYLMEHPDFFFDQHAEENNIDPDNLTILLSHIKCAAFELPFAENEIFGIDATGEILDYLAENRILKKSGTKYYWSSETYPADQVSLRSASPDNVVIVDTTEHEKVIGETDLFSAPMMLHKEAIYIHQGQQYHVDNLDWERKKAYVRQVDVDYFTDAITKTNIKLLATDLEEKKGRVGLFFGDINVSTVVTGYKKIKFYTHENVGAGKVYLPELEMATAAFWMEFPQEFLKENELNEDELSGALRGFGFNLRNILPLFVRCDVNDIRTVPVVRSPYHRQPTLYIYDNFPGGIGLAQKLWNNYLPVFESARNSIAGCVCQTGCPSCTGPGVDEDSFGKDITLKFLDIILNEFQE